MGSLRVRTSAVTLLVPGDLEARTGGYIYDRRIAEGLRELGWHVETHSLDSSFPQPTPAALHHARSVLGAISDGRIVVIDGLALGGMASVLEAEAKRLCLVALVHHPLALETGLEAATARALEQSERASLAFVRRVIVTSRWTAATLAEYGVEAERLRVVRPGIDPAQHVVRQDDLGDTSIKLLCVATLIPRKGHAVLVDALASLRDRQWHLFCAGSTTRDAETAAALRRQIDQLDLGTRISLLGETGGPALSEYYAKADVFVLASYMEGYGMALAEAVAYGLPVVSTTAGAIPETVPAGARLLVMPGDSEALAQALATVMEDPATIRRLRINALAGRNTLSTWKDASHQFAAALHETSREARSE